MTLHPEIAEFESFLEIIGFKRSDGSILGLLVLSEKPLSSEEIGKTLGMSQGAVSQGLRNLNHWGAIESRYSPERRARLHGANENSLSVVATVFQKREKGAIEAFKRANTSARARFIRNGDSLESDRIRRLDSNITTCEFAQSVVDFVVALSGLGLPYTQYARLVRLLPKSFSLLVSGAVKGEKILQRVLQSSRLFPRQTKEGRGWL